MNSEEKDPLWELLGARRSPAVSPFFSRNVLREVRLARQERGGFFGWLRRTRRIIALGTCALVLATLGGLSYRQQYAQSHLPLAVAREIVKDNDYDTISHLDELLAYEENSIWLEKSE